jgi:hypothetical protein
MPYTIDKYNGTTVAVVEDGTIDTTLDIKLIGKNYAGYGEVQNENFVHLLENFAGANQPPRPIAGQIWFDTANRKLKFYDANSARWKTTGGAEVSSTPPAGLSTGDFWYDSANKQIYVFDGTAYILVGPQGLAGFGTTEMKAITVTDNATGASHAIIQAFVDGDVQFIISTDEFTLSLVSAIQGFSVIKKGITLGSVNASTGVTLPGGDIVWGTSSDANRLGGLPASDYLTVADSGSFPDSGLTVGDQNDLIVSIANDGTTPVIRNQVSDTISFQTTTSGPNTHTPLRLVAMNILPGITETTNIGSSTVKFNEVHAVTFHGSGENLQSINAANIGTGTLPAARLSGSYTINIAGTATSASSALLSEDANKLKVGSAFWSADIAEVPGTIAARTLVDEPGLGLPDSSVGSIKGKYFIGTATSALFADLAEKYLADQEYEVGTVVCVGGEAEVTACNLGDRAFGAVSANPAYMMNAGLVGGTYIALKGRVPVKVIGTVKKGDKLIAGNDGCAGTASLLLKNVPIKAGNFPDTFAIALESSDDEGVKLVEAIIL